MCKIIILWILIKYPKKQELKKIIPVLISNESSDTKFHREIFDREHWNLDNAG